MDVVTYKALLESIAKWEENVKVDHVDDVKISIDDCPLCTLYFSDKCGGCPVAEDAGAPLCENTPYNKAFGAYHDWEWVMEYPSEEDKETMRKRFREAAQEEVDFLKSLLPKRSK